MAEEVKKWDMSAVGKAITARMDKGKYVLLILLLGVILMVLPTGRKSETVNMKEETPIADISVSALEKQLEALLSQIEGAGETKVMLTLHKGTAYEYQADTVVRKETDSREEETQTVFASGSNGTDAPVLIGVTYPVFQGAVVVCRGADRPSVQLAVIDAVSSLTGLRSEHIAVIKMKGN